MGFTLKGYVLEKPRVGSANSPFTSSPDNFVSDSATYNPIYGLGTNESIPGRTEYLALVLVDGNLPNAEFGWTKNEAGVQRFDYDGSEQRFKPMRGGTRTLVGTLGATSNTTRLKVQKPTVAIGVAPYRLAVGSTGSGTTFTITTVLNDGAFGLPAPGFVELSLSTGNLNWNVADLTTYVSQKVYFQRQPFFTAKESSGQLGLAGVDTILLTPIPGLGVGVSYQKPLVRFGFGLALTPIDVATEGGFSVNPAQGTFEWARDTGRVKFNSTDLTNNHGEPVYYDGVLFATGLLLPRQNLGTVASPSLIVGLPPAGGDLIFRTVGPGPVQFPEFVRLTGSFDPFGKSGQVQVNATSGAVQFSSSDVAAYGTHSVQVIFGDLPIERGISLRLFRSPVNLDASDPTLKDTSAFFAATSANFADPIIGAPFIFLPVLPIDDPAYPMVFEVQQGTGSFTGVLPRLDVPSPPAGTGYTLDFDQKRLGFAVRRNNQVTPIPVRTGVFQLSDSLVDPSNASFALNQGFGFVPLTVGVDALLEPLSGVVTFVETFGTKIAEGSTGSLSTLNTLNDGSVDFVASGVLAGDLLLITVGVNKGVYEIATVATNSVIFAPNAPLVGGGISYEVRRGKEILADRFFQEVSLADPSTKVEKIRVLGTVTNSPRLSIPAGFSTVSRFRFGKTTFSTSVTVVANDGAFTAPSALAQGVVEISAASNNLNFSQVDVVFGGDVYWVRKLAQGQDYRISPQLGLIQTIERLLAMDELFLTYTSTQDNPPVLIEERATFLVRKELTTHATPTSTIPFNPLGRDVASNPPPAVFRGGRPQDGTQVSVTASTITFLPDKIPTPGGATRVTDALPHGSVVSPSERVYIDYNVFNAMGGENTVTVLKPQINLAQVQIQEGASSFQIKGDRTLDFPADVLLRIEGEQVYYLSGSTYNAGADETTVSLLAPQVFRDGFSQPKLSVSSGPTRRVSAPFLPSYFVLESAAYDPIPRGMNKFKVQGNLAATYTSGGVVYLSGGSPTVYNDFYLVTGSTYNPTTDRTEINLTQPTARQYTPGQHVLRRSVRSILESSTTTVSTSATPALPAPFTNLTDAVRVFRQVEGQPGQLLSSPLDFTLDDSGSVKFASPLVPNEEFSILYTRHKLISPGQFRASFTATLAPNSSNGLDGQVLVGTYTTFSPDSFYYRVETLTNFRAEIAKQYSDEAKSSNPSGGPRTENTSQPKLFEQGRPSVFFNEGHLANEDLVARSFLKFYNDTINPLEDVLLNMDGRIIGDKDGRFKFDGTVGTVISSFALSNNQIDDVFKISDFPIDFTPPLVPFKFIGTYLKAYQASASSRFYPTARSRFGYTTVGTDTGAETGAPMVDLSAKNLTGTQPTAYRRLPRARITAAAGLGATTLEVDTTGAITTLPGPFRAGFANGMQVVIQDENGTYLIPELTPLTITVGGPTTLNVGPLPVPIPQGATVHLGALDTTYQKNYRLGFDIGVDTEKGFLLYIKPFFPFDGSVPLIPADLCVQNVNSQELLQTSFTMANSQTAPEKFPALYGGTTDDDGDQTFPLINPSYIRETAPTTEPGVKPSFLSEELTLLSGGSLVTASVAPFVGTNTGSLDVTRTILTNTTPFPAPVPQRGDLVRILSGLNGQTSFHRISSVGASTVMVDVPFTTQDTAFSFLITTASNLVTGVFSTIAGSLVTDLLANFIVAGVKPGHTVVLMQPAHPAELERRQVLSVNSATQITLTAPFSNTTTPAAYRIHNPRNTFSDLGGLTSNLASQVAVLATNVNSELNSIDSFYASIFTDRLFPAVASGNATLGDTLVGTGVDFVASGVVSGDLVYAPSPQVNEGFYTVASVLNPTTLTISDPSGFPSFPAAMTFHVVKVFGASEKTLKDLFVIRQAIASYEQLTVNWTTLVTSPVPVLVPPGVVDPTYFARGLVSSDISNRISNVTARKSYLDTTAIQTLENFLSSGDRLYDKRYTWIDARINLEKGIIVKQARAVTDRIKAQQDVLNQLTKLLAVEKG